MPTSVCQVINWTRLSACIAQFAVLLIFSTGSNSGMVKGSLTRDFRLQVFFMNQCPLGRLEFFRKFAEIFANE